MEEHEIMLLPAHSSRRGRTHTLQPTLIKSGRSLICMHAGSYSIFVPTWYEIFRGISPDGDPTWNAELLCNSEDFG